MFAFTLFTSKPYTQGRWLDPDALKSWVLKKLSHMCEAVKLVRWTSREGWWSRNVVEHVWFPLTTWETRLSLNGFLSNKKSTHTQRALKLLIGRCFKKYVGALLERLGSKLPSQSSYKALGTSSPVKVAHRDLHVLNLSSGWHQSRGSPRRQALSLASCLSVCAHFLQHLALPDPDS